MTNLPSGLPSSIKAQRVLLWVMAVLTLFNAWVALIDGMGYGQGPFFAMGTALPYLALGVLCAVLALKLRTGRPWVRVAAVIVYVFFLLTQLARLGMGDPLGLIGMLFPIAGLVLILTRGSRDHFAAARSIR